MTQYEIRSNTVDLSNLTRSEANALLSPLMGKTSEVFCLCNDRRPPMHVSRRGDNYFPVKDKNTGALHDKLCRHHKLTEPEAASMGYTLEAISTSDDDDLVVALAKPLKKGAPSPETIRSQYVYKGKVPRPVANRMTELGLLHLLWERSRLHEYDSTPDTGALWPKLRRAAYGIRPKGLNGLEYGLSDLLLLPLHAETANQSSRNFTKFKEAQKKNRFLLFVAKLKPADVAALLAAETNIFALTAAFGVNLSLYPNAAKPVLDAMKVSFRNELSYSQADGDELIVLGIAQPSAGKNYAQISSMVLMPVLGAIPYDSRHEKKLIGELVRQGRRFRKPLRYDFAQDMQVHPDFVLLDTPVPVALEVYGMNTPEYLARKKEKKAIYASDEYALGYWAWEAVDQPNLTRWLEENPLPSSGA